ncbi:hypothetical protein GF362_04135 [Candidatus Dojkabacteria bacterium]|nr:hypothetical protein [Candidatus Dojkabacteria bacterium]
MFRPIVRNNHKNIDGDADNMTDLEEIFGYHTGFPTLFFNHDSDGDGVRDDVDPDLGSIYYSNEE